MQIYGPGQVHGPQQLQGPHWNRPAAPSTSPQAIDQVDISPAADAAVRASETDFRADLVARVQNEIAQGTYETAEKLDAALTRLLDEVG